ncbi:receptor-like protein EIX2 [Gossypium arboreum]|uniref:receptor-like protein EIX2 n=1 Tax=Gossypium arboreum TaxID=29729 RepID=UPI0022F15F5A|nr:receptor-like protein EIX2 [Gossypium arboreum]
MSSKRSHKLVLFCAICCLLLREKCTDARVCKESERKALFEFKHSLQAMDLPGNDALSSWKSAKCCLWLGVKCNSLTGYVEMLDFSFQYWVVAGTISPSLLKLHHLTSLNFNSNDFNGSLIPEFFGSLKKLKLLDLSNANFRGPIPSLLGNLSMLETLRLGGNGGDVTFRHNLKEMYSVGKLEWLSHLSRLKEVDLSFTNLSNANDWSQIINHLPLLQKLSLRDCDLPSISSSSVSLTNSFTSLITLDLSDNNLHSFSIYPWLFNLKGPIPEDFGNMKAIQHLDLSHNLLNGSISKCIGQLSNLKVLLLVGNSFDGDVPSEAHFSNLIYLKEYQILLRIGFGTQVTAQYCFESFQSLTALNLGDNSFSGSLPSSLGSLTSLKMLSLRGNKFLGELPSSLQNCTRLKFLDLSDNELSGEIPIWIGQRLSSLVFLSLQGNQFRGRIPHQLCGLKYLQILDLSVNKISGTIPSCLINNFTSMAKKESLDRRIEHHILYNGLVWFFQVRYVDEALLTWKGTKQSYPQLGLLLAIDLSSNKLTGEIPEELNSLQELVALNLSRNIFTGKVLQKMGI